MITYEEILEQAKDLSSEERLRLADALLEEELGFGMWHPGAEIAVVESYVDQIRDADMRTPDGCLTRPEEFLRKVETFDE